MRKVIKIDSNGLYVEDVLLKDEDLTPDDCVETTCEGGFIHPKFENGSWIEGATSAVIAEVEEQKKKDNAKPSETEMIDAMVEIKVIEVLTALGVI
jgi:hypothetical protein